MNPTYQTMFQYVNIMQRDDPREITTSEFVTMCLSYPFRRMMDEEKAGVIPTPTGSQMAYLNDGLLPVQGDRNRRVKTVVNTEHEEPEPVVEEAEVAVAINDEEPTGDDEDKLIEPVVGVEAAMDIDYGKV